MKLFYASFSQYVYYALPIFLAGFTYGWENASMGGILAMPRMCSVADASLFTREEWLTCVPRIPRLFQQPICFSTRSVDRRSSSWRIRRLTHLWSSRPRPIRSTHHDTQRNCRVPCRPGNCCVVDNAGAIHRWSRHQRSWSRSFFPDHFSVWHSSLYIYKGEQVVSTNTDV